MMESEAVRKDTSLTSDEAELRRVLVSGLDLSANPRRCSGYSVIDVAGKLVLSVDCLGFDEEILDRIRRDKPSVVAVDAPLSPEPRWRGVDRLARKMGFKVMPPTLGAMRELTLRAWRVYEALVREGYKVIETHPSSVLASTSSKSLSELVDKIGLKCSLCGELTSRDMIDAVVAGVVAYCYAVRVCLYSIEAEDGVIYLAKV